LRDRDCLVRILLLNQTFPPDVVSSAQHAGDLARALAAAGHDVTVIASRRAYDRPEASFPAEADWHGVRVLRVRGTGFGKRARWRRAADFATLLLTCTLRLIALRRFDVVVAMTSPPLISFVAALYAKLRGGRLVLWVMDLNPDEAIAAGWLRAGSAAARGLEWCLEFSLRSASQIVVLDRFMKQRVAAKLAANADAVERLTVLAPWSHDSAVRYDDDGRAAFRRAHGLDGTFVVMYSGNHSPCHPLATLVEAAQRLRDRPDIAFCFVGGGSEFDRVRRIAADTAAANIRCIPYQPLSALSASLSSADLHVVVMGDPFVGIVHPCKVYNVLRLGIPFLYIGPADSHVTDLVGNQTTAWASAARHGDVDAVVAAIVARSAAASRRHDDAVRLSERFGQDPLQSALVRAIEHAGVARSAWRAEPAGDGTGVSGGSTH
jgi:putative colanic acid biosynthesis glycosyltransferase WcaI